MNWKDRVRNISSCYQELFLYQLRLQWMRQKRHQQTKGQAVLYDNAALKAFIQTLPFELTDGQKKVVNEICSTCARL